MHVPSAAPLLLASGASPADSDARVGYYLCFPYFAGDMYESTMDILFNLWETVPRQGYIIIDDW